MASQIVRFTDASEVTKTGSHAIPAIDAHPRYGVFGRGYYPIVYGDRRRDESFAVVRGDQVELLVPCSVGEGSLDWYGMPIVLFPRADLPDINSVLQLAFGHMERLVESFGIAHWTIREHGIDLSPVIINIQSTDRRLIASQWQTAVCDLSLDESEMHKYLRRRFKSLVNWGKRSLRMEFFGKQNGDPELYLRYRKFHHAVAGRITRSDATWDAMFHWIIQGHGEIAFGHLDDRLVSASMTIDGRTEAYYGSAVYDRTLFGDKKPLAHWPLWLSMLRAKQRGMLLYDLGDIPQEGQGTPKEITIGFFKRGFASQILTRRQWTMDRAVIGCIRASPST
jgi:hypothetical protein